jgi:hypothetical protein
MAWPFDKKEGETKTPEQSKEEAAAFISQLRTSFQEDLKASLAEQNTAFNQRFEAIEQKVTRPAPANPDPNANKLPGIFDDEDGSAAINARLAPLAVETVQLKARMVENDVIAEMREKGWSKYIEEVRKVLTDTPIGVKAQTNYENYVRGAVKMVVGGHAMEGGVKNDANGRWFVEDGAGGGETNTEEAQQLREESAGRYGTIENVDKWAQKMGISDVKALLKEPA